MNREIKFRAWDVVPYYDDEEEKREMIYFSLEDTRIIENLSLKSIEMEYTGLKDQKGNEIYEGDIVSIDYAPQVKTIGIIEFIGGVFAVKYLEKIGYRLVEPLNLWTMNFDNKCKVIGNIHQYPEILER